ncbi:hypothetical protein C2E21_0780 [Chlorella sorokiniana]|uniref:Uncharacterized protein n=1 Tax=Chlorella sorokiniana TaxID=3076 RepID=A0A2P6U2L9_CHLSO|nr:hypothetical protein C2E21_0780 [Chlorella sorokiniana]|eukprot:PRW60567.1 hypothetical protein C2E21_0780 [Chlorella sorokiniana]
MKLAVLLVALLVGAVAAAAAAGSPRKLLVDDATDEVANKIKTAQQEAAAKVAQMTSGVGGIGGANRVQRQPGDQTSGGGKDSGPAPQDWQPVDRIAGTAPTGVTPTIPKAGEIQNAVQGTQSSTPGDLGGFDIRSIRDQVSPQGANPIPVGDIEGLLGGLPSVSAPGADLKAIAKGAARAGDAIAATFVKATVKDGVAKAVAKGFAQAGCQGGTNFALSISLATAASLAGDGFVNAFNQNVAQQFPASRCSKCYTQTLTQANDFTSSLGGGDGFSSGMSVAFALGVCLP